MTDMDPRAWVESQLSADPEAPDGPRLSNGSYEPQLGRAPQGNLPPKSILETILRTGAQGITMGGADEIAGHAKAKKRPATNPYLIAKGIPEEDPASYKEERDAYRKEDASAEADHPVVGAVSELGGSLVTAPLAGAANTLRGAARVGVTLGGILGFNKSEEESAGGLAKDTAVGGVTGGILGPLGYGVAKGSEWLGNKVGDTGRALGELFGREPAANVGRAVETLTGRGSADVNTPQIQRLLESESIDKIPPSALAQSTPKAPDALARVSGKPRVQVAENTAKTEVRQALKGVRAQDAAATFASERANPDTAKLLEEVASGRMPRGNSNILADLLMRGKKLDPTQFVDDQNLSRVLADPAKTREAALLLLSARKPGIAPDAAAALMTRALTLLGVD